MRIGSSARVVVAAVALPLLTTAWILAMFRLVLGVIANGLMVNADSGQGVLEIEARRKADADFRHWIIIALAEVAAIAVVAFFVRVRWAGWLSLTVALALGACAGSSVWHVAHPTRPEPRPAPTTSQCVERSGGDTRCPGG